MGSESNNRIPKQNITYSAPSTYKAGSIDEVFLENSPDAIGIKKDTGNSLAYGSSGSFLVAATAAATKTIITPKPVVVIDPGPGADVPSLADIESIVFEEYPDALTGISKYNAIIKIRNSSKNKSNISGVDARIYNPNSNNQYTFTTATVASGSTVSTVVAKTTWYHAQSKCNPLDGSYGDEPYIVGNAQYQADGKDVPADSTSGPTSARIKSVWRKTSAEALEAAKQASCEL